MAGLESSPGAPIGQINPSNLVGLASPVVEPRAVAALAEAFRAGLVNENDIIDRVSEHTRSKQKADIAINNRAAAEANDPALIEARRQQALGAGAQGALAGAQATAAQGLVAPQAAAAASALETAEGNRRYPAGIIFDKYAPEVGLEVPMTPDGKTDFAKKAAIGAKLAAWATEREKAREDWKNIDSKTSADGTILFATTKQGQFVSPEDAQKIHLAGQQPFVLNAKPGEMVAPTGGAATPAASPTIPAASPTIPATSPTTGTAPLVQPRAGVSDTPPLGARAGAGFSLGPKTSPAEKAIPMTGEQQQLLGRTQFTKDLAGQLSSAYDNMLASAPNTAGGPIKGRFGTAVLAGERNPELATFQSKASGILAPLVKGIYGETGVLSERDIQRYQPNIPSVNDTPDVAHQKIKNLEEVIHTSIINNINSMDMQKQNLDPRIAALKENSVQELARIQAAKTAAAKAPTAAGAASPIIPTSTGRKFQRDAQGNVTLVP